MALKELYKQIDELRQHIAVLSPMKEEYRDRLWKKFRLEFNWNSNHLEGNTLTYSQTELLLIFDETNGGHTMREYEEMKAHDVALKMVQELAGDQERPLTETFIKQLNKLILVRPFWKAAITLDGQHTQREISIGEYKKTPNSVRLQNGEMFHFAMPEETAAKMGDLMDFYRTNSTNRETHALWLATMIHYKFVRIHPFDDGNGRVARLIMNYILLKNNFPPLIIKSADKKGYLKALHMADVGDFESFESYLAAQLIVSFERTLQAAKGEPIDEHER